MAAKDEKKPADSQASTLEVATNVLVRMEGHGRVAARRFLKRCTENEIAAIAACHCPELTCGREVGDKFKTALGEVVDAILKRQEKDEDAKGKG